MGFVKPPNQAYDKILFVNNCQGYPWSWPDNVPCKEVALEGKAVGLQIRQSEYKNEVSQKLHFLLKDEEFTYCVRCGLKTVFSRGLLLSLRACLSQQADCQIIISPKVSERDSHVIFCNLWANGQRVKIEWDKDINLYSLAWALAETYFLAVPFEKEDGEESFEVPIVPAEDNSEIISRIKNKKLTFSPEEVAEIKAASGIPTGEVDFKTLMAQNTADIKFLGLTDEQARNMLVIRYNKRSRQLLSDEELLDFVNYVNGLVKAKREKDDCPF